MNIDIIDAHQHFWDFGLGKHPWLCHEPPIPFRYGDYSPIRRDYLPKHYRNDAARQNVVATVYVETEWDPDDPLGELRWVEGIAQRHGLPNAVVAQAWMNRNDIKSLLSTYAQSDLVRGVRHKPQTAPTPAEMELGVPGSMSDPKWRAGFALLDGYGLSFDLQVPYWHLEEAADLARCFPATRIILNHTGLPADRSCKGLQAWRRGMEHIAANPNTAVKISGLGVPERPWCVEDNRSIVLNTIEIFGVNRCMFASNFPVDSLVADFDTIFNGFKEIAQDFTPGEQKQLFHDNAVRYYRLGVRES